MNRERRQAAIADSNNSGDPRKNVCALAVARALGVEDRARYLHTLADLLRACRRRYSVRSRTRAARASGRPLDIVRRDLAKLDGVYYIVKVEEQHAMLLNAQGHTLIDTAPTRPDHRRVAAVYAVNKKVNKLEALPSHE